MTEKMKQETRADTHDYLSTACLHGLHERCRKACKFCEVACRCSCHSQFAPIAEKGEPQ